MKVAIAISTAMGFINCPKGLGEINLFKVKKQCLPLS